MDMDMGMGMGMGMEIKLPENLFAPVREAGGCR